MNPSLIKAGRLPNKYSCHGDRETQTVARADAIVSWNFRHIVRLEKIRGYNEVNQSRGYMPLTIITPREVRLHEPDN